MPVSTLTETIQPIKLTEQRRAARERSQTLREVSWKFEQANHERNRLSAILRDPLATAEERRIASDMLHHYNQVGAL